MHRHPRRLVLPVVALLLAPIGWSRPGSSAVPTAKISLLPGRAALKVVIDASAPLTAVTAAYGRDLPAVLVVGLGVAAPPAKPAVPAEEAGLVRDVRIESDATLHTSLILTLAEPLPFTVTTDKAKTVIELTKILRSGGDRIPAEVQKAIDAAGRKTATLAGVDIADHETTVDLTPRLSRIPVTNIFALDNPLRLVVDLYDTAFTRPTMSLPVGRGGLAGLRIGQYKDAPPFAVARLVFDLDAAGPYRVSAGPKDWAISFGPVDTVAVAPAPAPIEAAPTVSEPVVEKPVERPIEKPVENVQARPAIAAAEDAVQSDINNKAKTIHDAQEKYSGDLLSPKFKDADLRDVVLWLGEKYGLNVFFDPEVRGSVTCSLENVPWDQFLDTILKINKMGKTLEGNILRIMPIGVLAEEERSLQQLRDTREQAGPLTTKTYELSYAKASDVLNLMKNRKSTRGDIVIDDRTNTLIATDVAEKIDLLDKLIAALDTPTPQVQIETRIIEASSTFVRNLGIQWGTKGVADPFYGNQTSLQFPNKIAVDGAMIPQGVVTRGVGGPLGGYAVNLPAPAFNTAVGVSFANILDSFRLDMALTAMESEGTGRIVSTQRATTLNNKEAYINQGRQIPVQTQANFTVTTQFFNAGLELRATPQITAEGTIIMSIDIQNNAADFANLVNGIPPITTQSAKTTVMVADGGTTVIGGIYRSEDSLQQERVPFLHQIPILGSLFKSMARTRTNRELLIFITPRIIY